MSKTEETELLGGEQPVSAVIIHTNWKGTFKQTAGSDSENADPLSPSPNQPLYGQIQSLVQKYEETARTLTGQTLTTGA